MAAPLPEYLVPGVLSSPPGRERMTVPYRTQVLTAVGHRYVRPIGDVPCAR
ncbi:hypothetical protein H9X95_15350 [Micromonospora chalcea]|nr:hypothetical protein [Micromonospora chalcea]